MKYIVLLIVLAASCSTTPKEVESTDPVKETTTAPVVVEAKSSAFSISAKGVVGLTVDETGEVFASGQSIGKLVDNTLFKSDGGVVATIKDNKVLDADGKTLVLIDEAGKLDNGSGGFLSWSAAGHFMKGEEDAGFVLEPNDPTLYRSASFVLFLYLSASKTTGSEPS